MHHNLSFLIVQKAFVITYEKLWLNLFHSFEDNTNNNDDRCTTEWNIRSEYTIKENWNEGDDHKTAGTDKDNIIKNFSFLLL